MSKAKKQNQVEEYQKTIFFSELDENIKNAKFISDIVSYYYDELLKVHFELLEDKINKDKEFINNFIVNDYSRVLRILKDIILLSK